jgi:hypothetical protein
MSKCCFMGGKKVCDATCLAYVEDPTGTCIFLALAKCALRLLDQARVSGAVGKHPSSVPAPEVR